MLPNFELAIRFELSWKSIWQLTCQPSVHLLSPAFGLQPGANVILVLDEIPASIGRLACGKTLRLNSNAIVDLPESFKQRLSPKTPRQSFFPLHISPHGVLLERWELLYRVRMD